jgi:hypothetical protein
MTGEALEALLPEDRAVPGWNRPEPPVLYGPENLWDCINGAAVLYLDYGFKSLATVYYETTDGLRTAGLEIYQMQSPLHAFAIYAAERSPQDHYIQMGVEGYMDERMLNFWKGPYYTKVSSYGTSEETKGILVELAGIVAERIPGQYARPEAFQFFPAENRSPKTERYIPKNFLGHSFLKAGYRVDYQTEGGSYQLFLIPNESPEQAQEAFAKYREYLESEGATVTPHKRAGIQAMSTSGGKTVFLHKSYIGGVLGMTDQDRALELVDDLMTKLETVNRKDR